jgi:hypothetical protein
MRRERTKQTFKLRLLAFVLALMLVWYCLHPAPRPVARTKREDESPDEKKLEAEPRFHGAALWPVALGLHGARLADQPSPTEDEDDFDWPDLIDG